MTGDVATVSTTDFYAAHLGPQPRRVIEVGCGAGDVAAALVALGHSVTAIDTSKDSVKAARELGVDALVADWLEFDGGDEGTFDAVLFSRSLHHISDLERAIAQVRRFLAPQGSVLVEDFAFTDCVETTALWLYSLARALNAAGAIDMDAAPFIRSIVEAADPHDAWLSDHDHDLHTADDMHKALSLLGRDVDVQEVQYLYRYFLPAIPGNAVRLARGLHDLERDLIARARLQPIGRRFVVSL